MDPREKTYFERDGAMHIRVAALSESLKPWESRLCNFTAQIIEEQFIRLRNSELSLIYIIKGKCSDGFELPQIGVSINSFSDMKWISEKWGAFKASVIPGCNVQLFNAIKHASSDVPRRAIDLYATREKQDV